MGIKEYPLNPRSKALSMSPHSCYKCGGIVRIFCPMQKDSAPCLPNHQTQQKDHQDQSHQHLYQSPPTESLQSPQSRPHSL